MAAGHANELISTRAALSSAGLRRGQFLVDLQLNADISAAREAPAQCEVSPSLYRHRVVATHSELRAYYRERCLPASAQLGLPCRPG